MAEARDDRISQALEELVKTILPQAHDEDDDEDDDRYWRTIESAEDTFDNAQDPSIAEDEGHVANLIREKLAQHHDQPDLLLKFSNLYERLLTQPVLHRKWGHLYLLLLLSPAGESQAYDKPARSRINNLRQDVRRSQSPATARASSARVIDEAFSRNGVPSLTTPKAPRERLSRPLPTTRRKEKEAMTNGIAGHSGGRDRTTWQKHMNPPESSLLRDLPFMLQGISTSNFTFTSSSTLKLPATLPGPMIALLHTLAEPGLLYQSLARFQESSDGGLVSQSLRSAISAELRSYLALVASLESQIRRASIGVDQSQAPAGKSIVTLKRCVVWIRDATMGLRLMSLIVEEARSRKGGQLISLIHSFASTHGDPFVGAFAERLLAHVTRPFYDMLRMWIYDGELSDPYLEFFVSENEGMNDESAGRGAISEWENKYKLDKSMVPTIMTEDFANKVFLIGKSLNFIRHGCGDSVWVESYSRDTSKDLVYGDTANLETSIDAAYKTTMARLLHLMNSKFKLNEHLYALKKYILLGQGDFVALLIESLSTNLNRPANTQFRHMLTAQLEHAIRNSNAQHDSNDIINRLDARMLNHSHGDIGWDVFTLEYKVDAPVDVIVTASSSRDYLKIFNFLWRVKRVEYALNVTYRRCMTGARGVLRDVDDKLGKDWKAARCAVAEMVHFVVQLQYYILFQVIEASWEQLQKAISKPECTLDDVISAHAKYLKSITRKGLLGRGHMEFTSQLHELLKTMLSYKDAVDGLYAHSNTEAAKCQQRVARIESRTAQGKWGITEKDEDDVDFDRKKDGPRSRDADSPMPPLLINVGGAGDDASMITALRQRLRELSNDFRAKVCIFLGDLAYQPDTDLRFLGVTMNWNNTYKITRRSKRRVEASSLADSSMIAADPRKANASEKTPATAATQTGLRGDRKR